MCSEFLCCLEFMDNLWSLICGLVQVLFLSLAVKFNFSIAIFLLLPLD